MCNATEPPPEPEAASTSGAAYRAPEGSGYDEATAQRRARSPLRRVRRLLSRVFVGLAVAVLPYLYYAYCWVVFRTSHVDDPLTPQLNACLARHGRFVALLWHQEVFTVAYAYRGIGGHTLASTGNFGRLITRMLELCDFTVFRGGSSGARSRRRQILIDMIRHMQREPRVGYGITVDGSQGPAFRMKSGGAVLARSCRAPLYAVRTWYSRRLTLPTWDRTTIPLPFGRIKTWAVGPYWIDPNASKEEFARACAHLEAELLELAELSYQTFPSTATPGREDFPAGWTTRWRAGSPGLAHGPHDLRPHDPPPWAAVAGGAAPAQPASAAEVAATLPVAG